MSDPKVNIQLIGDASKAIKAFGDTGSAGSKLASILKTGLVAGGLAAAAGLAALGGALVVCAKAASEDAQEQAKLAQVMRNTTGANASQIASMETWITKAMLATNTADSSLRQAFQNLLPATKNVAEAQGLMNVALDIAVAKGVPIEAVATAMAKAHDGNVGALGRLGIATKDAEGKTLSFEQVMANAAITFGGTAAAAADTTAGKIENLKLRFGELQENIGTLVLPVFDKLLTWITANWPVIESTITTALAVAGDAMGWVVTNVIPPLRDAFAALKDFVVNTVAPQLVAAWNGLKDWWAQYGPVIRDLIGYIKDAAAALVEYWEGNWKRIREAVNKDNPKGELGDIASAIGGLLTAARDVLNWFQSNWGTIGPIIKAGLWVALEPIKNIATAIWAIASAAEAAISALKRLAGAQNNYDQTHSQQGGPGGTATYGHPRAMAAGGIVTRPTFALIGEAGPEAIIPLSRRGQGKGIGSTITVNNYITGARTEGEAAGDATVRRLQAAMVSL